MLQQSLFINIILSYLNINYVYCIIVLPFRKEHVILINKSLKNIETNYLHNTYIPSLTYFFRAFTCVCFSLSPLPYSSFSLALMLAFTLS